MLGLGHQTDLLFSRHNGIVEEKNNYYVIRTPENPDYYFGNYLLLKRPATNADKERLQALFREDVGEPPLINHVTFCWSLGKDETSDVQDFIDEGFEYAESAVLTCEREALLPPLHANTDIAIRHLRSDDDWEQLFDLQMSDRDDDLPLDTYTAFLIRRTAAYRRLVEEGCGDWYGAFLGEELVGTLGLFFEGALGRFQEVLTKEEFRNRGICATLVHAACLRGFERAETLVIVADEHYHAGRVYASLGFRATEREASLCWWPREV